MKRATPWPASALAPMRPAAVAPPPLRSAIAGERGPWIATVSGIRVDLLAPTAAMIEIGDIAAGLRAPRWCGQTDIPLTILQHSVFVSRIVEQPAAPYALLHDAHEAYIGDVSSPMKAAIRSFFPLSMRGIDPVEIMAARFDQAIFHRFGLAWPMPAHIALAVRYADAQALATERRDLMSAEARAMDGWHEMPPPIATTTIRPLAWPKAQDQFIARFRDLFPGYGS